MNDVLNKAEVGKRIRASRENLNMSREQMAERVPMSKSFLQDVEGGTKGMSMDTFLRILKVLDVSADHILYGSGSNVQEDVEREIIFERIRTRMSACDMDTLRQMDGIIRSILYAVNRDTDQ